ncbi:MAG: patatin-like phospholipase RssA [Pseudomonadota bacterium]
MVGKQPGPKIGLALGSGSARGWSHIGVIRALAAQGIEPDIVTGCSIGAFVGAAYAKGELDKLEDWVRQLRWQKIVDLMDISFLGGGFLKGEKLFEYIRTQTDDIDIEDLPIPYGVITTDLDSGREVWLQTGSLMDAVRASIALPGLFTPAKLKGRWYMDGGLVNPVPVSLCRAMGAEIVIAVNLNGEIVGKHRRQRESEITLARQKESNAEMALWDRFAGQFKDSLRSTKDAWFKELLGPSGDIPGLFEVLAGSINVMQDRITRGRMAGDPPDVMLTPRLAHIGMLEFDRAEEVIAEGHASLQRMRSALDDALPH